MVSGSDPPPADVLAGVLDAPAAHPLPAAEYWPRLRPHLTRFGLSRVADITGLDRVGHPVAQAVRPMARSNAVTQGKAETLTGAAIGAVLECLEMAAGEAPHRFASAPAQDAALWHPLANGAAWPNPETRFVPAWDLVADRPAAVPADVISTDFAQGAAAEAAPILRSSIGLGAGASLAAAVRHGLLEAVEGDARLRAEHAMTTARITLAPDATAYRGVLERITGAGLRVRCEDMSRHGLAVVKASVMERPGASALPLPAVGYAARPAAPQAIAAAMGEAVQARLAVISGAREDITQRFYQLSIDPADLEAEWDRHAPAPGGHPLRQDAEVSLRALARRVGPVFAVPLFWDAALPLAITRVVAPALIHDPLRLEGTP